MAAGTVTVTRTRLTRTMGLIRVDWVSDASGDVSGNPFPVSPYRILQQATFVPGAGLVQPTNNHTIVVKNRNGCDMAVGKGASLSNSTPFLGVTVGPLSWIADTLDVVVSGAGDSKQGTVWLIVQQA
jgi:hypothetical protein